MKRSGPLRLALMASLPAVTLGCDNPAIHGAPTASPPSALTPRDCTTEAAMRTSACLSELERVVEFSPRYASRAECEAALGAECGLLESDPSAPAWVGPMTGFAGGYLLARALDDVGDSLERRRRYAQAAGAYRPLPPVAGRPAPPARAVTGSRAGFGSTAAARSSFGGRGG